MRSANQPRLYLWLAAVAALPLAGVLLFHAAGGGERTGADEQAAEVVSRVFGYQPWLKPLWSPPGAGAEALLFAVQAAAGAALLGLAVIGLRAGRKK